MYKNGLKWQEWQATDNNSPAGLKREHTYTHIIAYIYAHLQVYVSL